jgi:hypothetical protein
VWHQLQQALHAGRAPVGETCCWQQQHQQLHNMACCVGEISLQRFYFG